MFDWLFNSIEKKLIATHRSELVEFRDSLKGMSSEELGLVLAYANHVRAGLESIGHKPLEPLTYSENNPSYQHELFASIKKLQQQGQPIIASAMMVWLHTARSGVYPQLRHVGQEIWKELQRGLPYCEEAAEHFFASNGVSLITVGASSIPFGMESQQ